MATQQCYTVHLAFIPQQVVVVVNRVVFLFVFVWYFWCSPRVLPLATIPEVGTVNVTNLDPDPERRVHRSGTDIWRGERGETAYI